MSLTSIGLWLAGCGSVLIVGAALGSPPESVLGVRFKSSDPKSLRDAVAYAIQTTGLGLVAVGSLAVAASQRPAWWLIGATVLAVLGALDVLLARSLKQTWDEKSHWAALVADTGEMGKTAAAQRQAAIGRRCATWRWCLLHPLNRESWPGLDE
jgi:hypothetical protein